MCHSPFVLSSNRAYDAADYGKYIYPESPEPRLAPADEA